MVRLDVFKSPELLATIYALRAVDKTLQAQVRKQTKAMAQPEWKKALAQHADTMLEHRVLVDTAVISVSNQNVRVQSANKGRPRSGGLNPKTDWAGVEFGSHAKGKTYRRKNRGSAGGTHSVTRVMGTQFKAHKPNGYVFYPTAAEMIPRLASLWVQTAIKTIANALEGKRE